MEKYVIDESGRVVSESTARSEGLDGVDWSYVLNTTINIVLSPVIIPAKVVEGVIDMCWHGDEKIDRDN